MLWSLNYWTKHVDNDNVQLILQKHDE